MEQLQYKVVGGKPVFGEITLSGDSEFGLVAIIERLMHSNTVSLSNAPRSPKFLKYLNTIEKAGVSSSWVDVNEVKLSVGALVGDLTGIVDFNAGADFNILVPFILYRSSVCKVKDLSRKWLKFYEDIGFIVEVRLEEAIIRVPNLLPDLKNFPIECDNLFDWGICYLCTLIFGHNIDIKYNDNDHLPETIKNFGQTNSVRCTMDIDELDFYLGLAAITEGELVIRNYDLVLALESLMYFEKIGLSYEVVNKSVKIWYSKKSLESLYDLSQMRKNLTSYYIAIINKLITHKHIRVVFKNLPELNDLINNLNIVGSGILNKTKNEKAKYQVYQLKGFKTNHPIKTSVMTADSASLMLLLALGYQGIHKILGLNNLAYNFSCILDNLDSIGCDIQEV